MAAPMSFREMDEAVAEVRAIAGITGERMLQDGSPWYSSVAAVLTAIDQLADVCDAQTRWLRTLRNTKADA